VVDLYVISVVDYHDILMLQTILDLSGGAEVDRRDRLLFCYVWKLCRSAMNLFATCCRVGCLLKRICGSPAVNVVKQDT
jgi:hypothetical protein